MTQIVEALMQPVAEEPQGQVLASITALERLRGKGNLKTSTHNAVSTVLFKRDSTSPIGRIVFAMLGSVMGLTPVKKKMFVALILCIRHGLLPVNIFQINLAWIALTSFMTYYT